MIFKINQNQQFSAQYDCLMINKMEKQQQDFNEEKYFETDRELFKIGKKELYSITHRSIGALTFRNKGCQGCGSGTLISKDLVLTAAHNIYNKSLKCENTDFKFILGAKGAEKEEHEVEAWMYLPEYKDCPGSNKLPFDYALLKLKQPAKIAFTVFGFLKNLTQQTEFPVLSYACSECTLKKNEELKLEVFGYPRKYEDNYKPLDKEGKSICLNQYGLAHKNQIKLIDHEKCKIAHTISTLGGHSGCPIIAEGKIIAIHNGGGKIGEQFNVGRLVTFDFVDNLKIWRHELKGHPFKISDSELCSHLKLKFEEYKITSKRELNLDHEYLSVIDVKKYVNIKRLDLNYNQLKALDVSNNIKLEYLDLKQNQLASIDVSNLLHLTLLSLAKNNLVALDVRGNPNLTNLYLYNNQLAEIDVRNNHKLKCLIMSENRLTDIDLSNNIDLVELDLSRNNLTAIDLNSNIQLTNLCLEYNQLKEINLANNVHLYRLRIEGNYISAVKLWIHSSLPGCRDLFDLHLQKKQSRCEIKMLHSKEDSLRCEQLRQFWTHKYKNDVNKCEYIFTSVEQNQ